VIAIGQLARGGIAIGQLAFGLVGWGQLGGGVFHAVGMLGVGGRGFGPVLRLIPSVGRPCELPRSTSLAAVESGEGGWVEAQLTPDLHLAAPGASAPIKLDRRLQTGARRITTQGSQHVLAYVRPIGPTLVCERITYEPPRPYQQKSFWTLAAFQLAGLLVLATAWAGVVGHDVAVGLGKVMGAGTPSPHAPPTRPAHGRSR
jgi:hypothetical protein